MSSAKELPDDQNDEQEDDSINEFDGSPKESSSKGTDDSQDGEAGESLDGSDADQNQIGGSGNDDLVAGLGDDHLDGDDGDDNLNGGQGNDDLIGGSGHDHLYGGAGIDRIHGDDGDDELFGDDGDDSLDGGSGHDIAHYAINFEDVDIVKTADGYQLQGLTSGIDSLVNIERVSLLNSFIALDLNVDQSGGETALLLGACLGSDDAFGDDAIVGEVISYFDAGNSMDDACDLLVSSGTVAALAGGEGNHHFIEWLYANVVGGTVSNEVRSELLDVLESGEYSQASFLSAVVQSDLNQQQINLVGLQETGLEYV